MSDLVIHTIGHSNHPLGRFIELLQTAEITAVGDVRTTPYSRRFPHFNQPSLSDAFKNHGMRYVFLGAELGGRPADKTLWSNGRPDYRRMTISPAVHLGLARVREGARAFRLALMCSEGEPLDCHRCILVARALAADGVTVRHILSDGAVKAHAETEERLLAWAKQQEADLFSDPATRLDAAYEARANWLWKTNG